VRRARAGRVAPAEDPEAIAAALGELVAGESGFDAGTLEEVRAEYSHPRMAEAMAGVVEAARG
jgi:hypothetical protein